MKIIVAVTGASGSVYSRLLLEELLRREDVGEVALVASRNGRLVAEYEGEPLPEDGAHPRLRVFGNEDMFAAPASGSARYDAMVVIPCSMGTAARIACGTSDNLICRAADVMLKERRRLVIVPREAPMSTIHLRNLTTLSECGAVVIPASPSFYARPDTLGGACMSVVERVIDHLGLDSGGYRWGNR